MAYHSKLWVEGVPVACGAALVPFREYERGQGITTDWEDSVDETLLTFKANILMRSFEVRNPGDRTLIYLTWFVTECLDILRTAGKDKVSGERALSALAREAFSVPGSSSFPLGGYFPSPKDRTEEERFRGYMKQAREQIVVRLIDRYYLANGTPNKFWSCFGSKKFLNIGLNRHHHTV